jgi:hypothetical protein
MMAAFPGNPNLAKVAKKAQVSQKFLKKVVEELQEDDIMDPDVERKIRKSTGVCGFLDVEHELLLLGLRAKNPARSNINYSSLRDIQGFDFTINGIKFLFEMIRSCWKIQKSNPHPS